MTAETIEPTVHEAMARFRSSLLRRASAVAWVVLIVIGAQAVRSGNDVFTQPNFYIPITLLAILLVVSAAMRWDRIMATNAAPWVATSWLLALIVGITALAMIPGIDTARCRKPEILADAAHAILTRAARGCTGNFFLDDEVLAEDGITDLDRYAVAPGQEPLPDLFLD